MENEFKTSQYYYSQNVGKIKLIFNATKKPNEINQKLLQVPMFQMK